MLQSTVALSTTKAEYMAITKGNEVRFMVKGFGP